VVDLESKIRLTLALTRRAISALEADPQVFHESVEHVRGALVSSLEVPADNPDVRLREIEHILAQALARLQSMEG